MQKIIIDSAVVCQSIVSFRSKKSNALATINPQGKSFPKIIYVIYQFHMYIYKQSSWHQINGSVHVYFKRFYWSLPIFSLKMNLYFRDTSTCILSWLPWRYGPVSVCLYMQVSLFIDLYLAKHWQEISPQGHLKWRK